MNVASILWSSFWAHTLVAAALVLADMGSLAVPASTSITFVPRDAVWQYRKGTSEASQPIGAWRTITFDPADWSVGSAPFHYGEPGVTGGTVLNDMRNAYSSVFLRREFLVSNPATLGRITLKAVCDDGFIAWINGVEVARFNMPPGERAHNSFASRAVTEPVSFTDYPVPGAVIGEAGRQVLAVQVFNNSLTSSDLLWNATLEAEARDEEAPRVIQVQPAPGTVSALAEVIVTFSEPVTGVRAQDLFLGPRAATSVTGGSVEYRFLFDAVPAGTWELRWDGDTDIRDLGLPGNLLDLTTAGPWVYRLLDGAPPVLSEVHPRPGLTLRTLDWVEVGFSEPVEGVEAGDLRVNGVAALDVTGAEAGPYRFRLPPVNPGEVTFSWALDHGIRDRAQPPNDFVGQEWSVTWDPEAAPPTLRINEFLATNRASGGFKDEDGSLEDWIELFNDSDAAVSLEGWALTDDTADPGRWVFPAVTLGPGQFLVIHASGKDRRSTTPGRRLHTNFQLAPDGEYLALLSPDSPRAVVSGFTPAYPEQRNNISYGYHADGRLRYFRQPTPGAANGGESLEGVVSPPEVNVGRGWYDAPVQVWITAPEPGTTLRYTTDGSDPEVDHGRVVEGPLRVERTTVLRVAGFQTGRLPSRTVTHTYLFADDILRQPEQPAGFPSTWGTYGSGDQYWPGNRVPADYGMDPEIVDHPEYGPRMKEALLGFPALSIVIRNEDLFDATSGIYAHPLRRGPAWERACSVEFMPLDGEGGFQVGAGVQIQGNAAREPAKQPKHPLRLVFKADYGPTALEFPLFPESPVARFDTLVLRADFNYSWLHWSPDQRRRGTRMRDAWTKDTLRAMGGLASHNRYLHLFLNGLYWGIYDATERPDGAMAAAYLGGEKEDFDVINEGEVVDGSRQAYDALLALDNLADPARYTQVRHRLELRQFIDYMLLHFYVGHSDWGRNKNWYTFRPKDGRTGFYYVPWDGENLLDAVTYNRVGNTDTPSGLHSRLVENAEYRLAFADRAHRHLFHQGALTPAATIERWQQRAATLELPILAESARWGDYRRDVHPYASGPYELFTRDQAWRTEHRRLVTDYFPRRASVLLDQLRQAGLYPVVAAPHPSQAGGRVPSGFALALSAPGPIHLTLDGRDPRVEGTGAVAPSARLYNGPVPLQRTLVVKARTLQNGTWSALFEAAYEVGPPRSTLEFTEVMYRPPGGDAYEFVELLYRGDIPLDLSGYAFSGIEFVFPHGTLLQPGRTLVLASGRSPAQFAQRYPGVAVDGYFRGALANGGERLEVRRRGGAVLAVMEYGSVAPWPVAASGQGFSLERVDLEADPRQPAAWRASALAHGSPGQPTTLPPAGVRLSEVRAAPNPADPTGQGEDWIELQNTGDTAVGLDGWTLADTSGRPFTFPAGTSLSAGSYLVVTCGGGGPGLTTDFGLERGGETVTLHDAQGRFVDAVSYGPQLSGYTLGRPTPTGEWALSIPTPGGPHRAAPTAPTSAVRINEWMARPRPGAGDWLELHNLDPELPVDLRGWWLVREDHEESLRSPLALGPGGFLRLDAERGGGPTDLGFALPAAGAILRLLDPQGVEVDRITYGPQALGVSEGRHPDGAGEPRPFPFGGTPGRPNLHSQPMEAQLHEVMADDGTGAGWVELVQAGTDTLQLGGDRLEFTSGPIGDPVSWTIPVGVRLAPGEPLVVHYRAGRGPSEDPETPLFSGGTLERRGGVLRWWSAQGPLRDQVAFGAQILGQTIGRVGSTGGWALLALPTPGLTQAVAAELGDPGQVRFNEWMAAPESGDDWFEMYHPGLRPLALEGWYLSDDLTVAGARRFPIGPLTFLGPQSWMLWWASGDPTAGPDQVNFALGRSGEGLRWSTPDGHYREGVEFGWQTTGRSEGRTEDGGPIIQALAHGPSPGRSNLPPVEPVDSDGDGLPDAWEREHGTDPHRPDADEDTDGDGMSHGEEYLAGTDPQDRSSLLRLTGSVGEGGGWTLEFLAMPGRAYEVQANRKWSDPDWQVVGVVPVGQHTRIIQVHPATPTEAAVFFRVVMIMVSTWQDGAVGIGGQ